MTARDIAFFSFVLVLLGAAWGVTIPLTKIAVSTGFGHFGLIFWQLAIGSILMAVISLIRGRGVPITSAGLRICAVVALVGTLIPNTASYQAAVHVSAGVLSLLLSMIPMFAFPVALCMGLDRFSWRRLGGLAAGLCGVLVIILPGVDGTMNASVFWMVVALIAGLCYAVEGNIVAKWGTAGLDAIQVLFGASVLGMVVVLPLTLAQGHFIPPHELLGAPGYALIAASVAHTLAYTGYVWLVGRAGPVFTVQVSYLVTGFGLLWARLLLDEVFPPAIWAALGLMFLGMYLVQPRRNAALAPF